MNDVFNLMIALFSGVLLGLFFFGGLWWTVKKGVTSSHPALFFLSSLLLRTAVVLCGLYLIGHGHWQRMIACFLGFIIARPIVTVLTRNKSISQDTQPPEDTDHASQS